MGHHETYSILMCPGNVRVVKARGLVEKGQVSFSFSQHQVSDEMGEDINRFKTFTRIANLRNNTHKFLALSSWTMGGNPWG